jgi:hypothetical protein
MTDITRIIRVLPKNASFGLFGNPLRAESFYDLTSLTWAKQNDICRDLEKHGYLVQDIFFDDIMPLQVGAEIRRRAEEDAK